jgi:membrane-associated phospholipid phosphatase
MTAIDFSKITRFLYKRSLFIGKYEPIILYVSITYKLWVDNKPTLLNYYLVGIILNTLLNILLKIVLRQPRPSHKVNNDLTWYNKFGMPSGHTQSVGFSTIYMFYSLDQTYRAMAWYILLLGVVTWQRVFEHHHTLAQSIVGLIVGGVFGHIVYTRCRRDIVGRLSVKPDDQSKVLPSSDI